MSDELQKSRIKNREAIETTTKLNFVNLTKRLTERGIENALVNLDESENVFSLRLTIRRSYKDAEGTGNCFDMTFRADSMHSIGGWRMSNTQIVESMQEDDDSKVRMLKFQAGKVVKDEMYLDLFITRILERIKDKVYKRDNRLRDELRYKQMKLSHVKALEHELSMAKDFGFEVKLTSHYLYLSIEERLNNRGCDVKGKATFAVRDYNTLSLSSMYMNATSSAGLTIAELAMKKVKEILMKNKVIRDVNS